MSEQRATPEQRAELWRRYEAALADIEATWPWQHALTIAAPALLADADALTGALKETARLQSLVDACVEVLGHAMIRSDGDALHLAGFRVWEMLTEVPGTGGDGE